MRKEKGEQRESPVANECPLVLSLCCPAKITHTSTTKISPATPNPYPTAPGGQRLGEAGCRETRLSSSHGATGRIRELSKPARHGHQVSSTSLSLKAQRWAIPPAAPPSPDKPSTEGRGSGVRGKKTPSSLDSREGLSPSPRRRSSERLGLCAELQTDSGGPETQDTRKYRNLQLG